MRFSPEDCSSVIAADVNSSSVTSSTMDSPGFAFSMTELTSVANVSADFVETTTGVSVGDAFLNITFVKLQDRPEIIMVMIINRFLGFSLVFTLLIS